MAFKIICENCGNSGRIFNKKDTNNAFFRSVRIDGGFTLNYGDSGGYDFIEIRCNECSNKVEDI